MLNLAEPTEVIVKLGPQEKLFNLTLQQGFDENAPSTSIHRHAQRFIITGRVACSSTCRVTPPRMSWRNRECE